MHRAIAIAAALVWTSTGAAWAQSANPPLRVRPFIDVGLFYPDREPDFTETSSLTTGASFGVGVMLSRQSGLRFEAEIPGWHSRGVASGRDLERASDSVWTELARPGAEFTGWHNRCANLLVWPILAV
jgi:hypothetical protein